MRPNLNTDIRYRSFLLNPDLAPQGVDRQEYLESKFGGVDQYDKIAEALIITGISEGIDFKLNKIQRTPNSANSHRLVRMAQTLGRSGTALDLLFKSYFELGLDIGDTDVLLSIAETLGLEQNETLSYLNNDDDLNAVYTENARMHRLGITGVPCFIFNDNRAIAGAQETEILTRMIDMAAAQDSEQPAMQSNG
tara:strand:+ start:2033 stop:2614 length:582 start_codon:yes stop_codon:yes gene_type:complete